MHGALEEPPLTAHSPYCTSCTIIVLRSTCTRGAVRNHELHGPGSGKIPRTLHFTPYCTVVQDRSTYSCSHIQYSIAACECSTYVNSRSGCWAITCTLQYRYRYAHCLALAQGGDYLANPVLYRTAHVSCTKLQIRCSIQYCTVHAGQV
jgi:hypothetical protein